MIWIVATGAIDIAKDQWLKLSILIDFENRKIRIMMIIDDFTYITKCFSNTYQYNENLLCQEKVFF